MNKTYKIITFGCQMNENDSEKLSGLLQKMGYTETDNEHTAGLIIINTCSVRENADVRTFGNLGIFKHIKATENPDQILAVCGCMMQQEEIVKKIKEKYPHVDIVFGTHNIHRFPELLGNYLAGGERVFEIWEDSDRIVEGLPTVRKYPFKAFVTIMNGCNNFCTYCIVPYTRGREVSRRPEDIINEVKSLVNQGVIEIMLLGQNVNSYNNDKDSDYHFADLLRDLNKIEGLERIRFMTNHPKDLTDDVIDAIAECEHVCPAIHLAIQSGSSRVLEMMNRRYTKEKIIELVKKIRNRIPGAAITTDIIVGFPGETEADFAETIDVVKKCCFDSAFSFIYSIRPGTPAATMEDQIPDDIKHDRLNRLLECLHECSAECNSVFQDQIVPVLVEGKSKSNDSRLSGRTMSGKLVNFEGSESDIGKIIDVEITHAKTFSLDGKAVIKSM